MQMNAYECDISEVSRELVLLGNHLEHRPRGLADILVLSDVVNPSPAIVVFSPSTFDCRWLMSGKSVRDDARWFVVARADTRRVSAR